MKRAGILGLAIALTLGLAVPASQAAKAKKVDSEVEVEGWYYPPPEYHWTLVGDVHAKTNKCEKGREVTILGLDSATDDGVVQGTVTTDGTGDWEFDIQDLDFKPYHAAEVERKKIIKANGKKIVCKADRSPALYND
jgi:hypothetical protein